MPADRGATHQDYYDTVPSRDQRPGDIWRDLPTGGLLGCERVRGIVITPACDLANSKVETITYLPVVPMRSVFSLVGALPQIRRSLIGQLKVAEIEAPQEEGAVHPLKVPKADSLTEMERAIQARLQSTPGAKATDACARASAGVRVLRVIAAGKLAPISNADIELLHGKDWEAIKRDLIKNKELDFYFLPYDRQSESYSGVPEHSLVLFRYPITIPAILLEMALDADGYPDWENALDNVQAWCPTANAFRVVRPIKLVSLRIPFISDLLTRYVRLYGRLGSPDFTTETIERYCSEVSGAA